MAAPGALRDLPLPMLAAIVITAAVGLIDVAAVRRLYQVRRSEFVLWLTAFLGVALLGVLFGIFVAILLSLADFVRRAWRPHDAVLGREDELKGYHDIDRHPSARLVPGLLLYRFDAPLFFANAGYFRRRVRHLVTGATHPVRWVVVAAEPITDIDSTAADNLHQLLEELRQERVTLAFAELKGRSRTASGATACSTPSAPTGSSPPPPPGPPARTAPGSPPWTSPARTSLARTSRPRTRPAESATRLPYLASTLAQPAPTRSWRNASTSSASWSAAE